MGTMLNLSINLGSFDINDTPMNVYILVFPICEYATLYGKLNKELENKEIIMDIYIGL